MKKKKKKISLMDYVKANRKGSREAEIENYGHPINYNRVQVSKKVYNRKRNKADLRQGDLPYSFNVPIPTHIYEFRNPAFTFHHNPRSLY